MDSSTSTHNNHLRNVSSAVIRDCNSSRPLENLNQKPKTTTTRISVDENGKADNIVTILGKETIAPANPSTEWNTFNHFLALEEMNRTKTKRAEEEKKVGAHSKSTTEKANNPNPPSSTIHTSTGRINASEGANQVAGLVDQRRRKQAEPMKIPAESCEVGPPPKKPMQPPIADSKESKSDDAPGPSRARSARSPSIALNESQVQQMLRDVETAVRKNIGEVQTSRPLTLHDLLHSGEDAHASPRIPFNAPACPEDKDYWNGKSPSARCPRGCPLDNKRMDNLGTRQGHYKSVHPNVYYVLVTSKRGLIEDYLCKNLGGPNGPRACIHCEGSARLSAEFKDRISLARHIKNHRKAFRTLCAGYSAIAINGRRAECSQLHVILTP